MYQNLKAEIKDIIEIVKQCPERLQEKCFELLLENYLSSNSKPQQSKTALTQGTIDNTATGTHLESASKEEVVDETTKTNPEEIRISDFHVKTQRFLKDNSISEDVLNSLYYKEGARLMPFYETLKSTRMATCQVRLALLTAFENSFADANGDFSFNGEVVRERCQTMKCYDGKNFATNFKKSNTLWENWPEKYDGDLKIIVSSEGKKELGKVLLDLFDGN